ncbi:MAG: flagellar hook-length control protein FliK [Pseudomonadota bacterium]
MQTSLDVQAPEVPRAFKNSGTSRLVGTDMSFRELVKAAPVGGDDLPRDGSLLPQPAPSPAEVEQAVASDDQPEINEEEVSAFPGYLAAPPLPDGAETLTMGWLPPVMQVTIAGVGQAAIQDTPPAVPGKDPANQLRLPGPAEPSGQLLAATAAELPPQGTGTTDEPLVLAARENTGAERFLIDPRPFEGSLRRQFVGDGDNRQMRIAGPVPATSAPEQGLKSPLLFAPVTPTPDDVPVPGDGEHARPNGFNTSGAPVTPADDSALVLPPALPETGEPGALDRPDSSILPTAGRTPETTTRPILQLHSVAGTPAFLQEMGDTLRMMISGEKDLVVLRLNPEHLGALEVHLESEDDQVKLTFISQNGAARDLLDAALPRLRDQLASSGFQLAGAAVSADGMAGGDNRRPGVPLPAEILKHAGFDEDEAVQVPGQVRTREGRVDTFA